MENSSDFSRAVKRLREKKAAFDAQRPLPENQRLLPIKATVEPFEVTVLSPLTFHHIHFVPGESRSRKCGFAGCLHCRRGIPVQTRFLLAIQFDDGRTKLFELSERHRPTLELMGEGPNGQIGARLRIWKKWDAVNAPIVVEVLGFRQVVPMEIDRLVASMSLPAERVVERS